MRSVLLLVASVVGVAVAWPEGQPNCAVAGNWSDPEKTDVVNLVTEEINEQKIQRLVFNTSGVVFNGSTSFEDGRSAVIHAAAANETVILNIVCHNNALWVMLTPSVNSNRTIRVLTLNRIPQPPPLLVPIHNDADPIPSSTSRYLLVNITLPQRSEDDAITDNEVSFINDDSRAHSEDNNKKYNEAKFADADSGLKNRSRPDESGRKTFNKDGCSLCSRENDDHAGSDAGSFKNKDCRCRTGHGNQCVVCSRSNNNDHNNGMTMKNEDHAQSPSDTMFPTDNLARHSDCDSSTNCNNCNSSTNCNNCDCSINCNNCDGSTNYINCDCSTNYNNCDSSTNCNNCDGSTNCNNCDCSINCNNCDGSTNYNNCDGSTYCNNCDGSTYCNNCDKGCCSDKGCGCLSCGNDDCPDLFCTNDDSLYCGLSDTKRRRSSPRRRLNR